MMDEIRGSAKNKEGDESHFIWIRQRIETNPHELDYPKILIP